MSKRQNFIEVATPGDPFDQQPTTDDWQAFAKALDENDAQAVRQFLIERELPAALGTPLSMIRPEAARLQAIVDAGVSQSEIDAAEDEHRLLGRTHPQTAADAVAIAKRVTALAGEIRTLKARHDAAIMAAELLAGLKNVFAELFDGTDGKTMCGGIFAHAITNAILAADLDPHRLVRQPWREAYRLQPSQQQPRRKLRTVR